MYVWLCTFGYSTFWIIKGNASLVSTSKQKFVHTKTHTPIKCESSRAKTQASWNHTTRHAYLSIQKVPYTVVTMEKLEYIKKNNKNIYFFSLCNRIEKGLFRPTPCTERRSHRFGFRLIWNSLRKTKKKCVSLAHVCAQFEIIKDSNRTSIQVDGSVDGKWRWWSKNAKMCELCAQSIINISMLNVPTDTQAQHQKKKPQTLKECYNKHNRQIHLGNKGVIFL